MNNLPSNLLPQQQQHMTGNLSTNDGGGAVPNGGGLNDTNTFSGMPSQHHASGSIVNGSPLSQQQQMHAAAAAAFMGLGLPTGLPSGLHSGMGGVEANAGNGNTGATGHGGMVSPGLHSGPFTHVLTHQQHPQPLQQQQIPPQKQTMTEQNQGMGLTSNVPAGISSAGSAGGHHPQHMHLSQGPSAGTRPMTVSGPVSGTTATGGPSTTATTTAPSTSASSALPAGSNEFVRKLFALLEDTKIQNIVRWTESGDRFVVLDTNEFTTKVLPRHFKHSNFASFVRQLNKYDFHKIRASESGEKYGDNAWVFRHPDFQQHNLELLDNIRRKTTVSSRKVNTTTATTTTTTTTTGTNNVEAPAKIQNSECEVKRICGNGSTCSTGDKAPCDPAAICGPVIAAEITSRHAITQALEKRIIELEAGARRSQDEVRTLSGLNSVLLQRLHSAQSAIQTTTSILRKLIILSSGSGEATDKFPGINNTAYLDLLQSLNTMESTRNDSPIVGLPIVSRRSSMAPAQRPAPSLSPIDSPYSALLPTGAPLSAGLSPAYTENGVILRAQGTRHSVSDGGGRPLVLLVDDDHVSARKIGRFVREFGCDVEVTNDGVDAWHRARAREESLHAGASVSSGNVPPRAFSLILMDLVIPSLDGKTAATQMRKSGVGAAIVVMTSAATEEVQEENSDGCSKSASDTREYNTGDGEKDSEARLMSRKRSLEGYFQAGISEVLVKPFKKEDLFRVLRRYLGDVNGVSNGGSNITSRNTRSESSEPGGLVEAFGLDHIRLDEIGLEDIGLGGDTPCPDHNLNEGLGGLHTNHEQQSSSSSASSSTSALLSSGTGLNAVNGHDGTSDGDGLLTREPKRPRMY